MRTVVVSIAVAAAMTATTAPAHADPAAESGAHTVTYTVVAQSELNAQIYYLASEPPGRAEFDADSSKYLTNVKVPLKPGVPWVFQTTLADPTQWALVSASGALRVPPNFHCEIAVDGAVVVQSDGGSGTQCSLRAW
ncbi:hypothetical protein [Mycobacterium sp. IS-1742]|uniref:hypothetical protein n=1 Tax=Mycobacterium sp. IS-1742 TaxID=1772285 RepID=UPI000B0F2B3D|nr:hypothetical protein [Mycobacterium sp. IS-1742]